MIDRIFVMAGFILIFTWLVRIISDMADMAKDIRYIKNWVSVQSLTVNATDITMAIDKAKSDLMVELACVGAKNNADILRVKDGFQEGDVIEIEGVRLFVIKRIARISGSLAGYIVIKNDGGSEYRAVEEVGSAKFVKHIDGCDDIFS